MGDIEGTGFETKSQLFESKLRRLSIELERHIELLERVAQDPITQEHTDNLRTVEVFLSNMHIVLHFEVTDSEMDIFQPETMPGQDPSLLKDLRIQLIRLKAYVVAINEKLIAPIEKPSSFQIPGVLRILRNNKTKQLEQSARETLLNMISYLEEGAIFPHGSNQRIDITHGIMTLLAKLSHQDA